ncbi:hypothetical protein ACNQGP_15185 [Flavobacterium sp. GT2N3]|uniref:hypothetical protein n=1 Tax=unclassified Flavobacterium TaxID=196869 RepID=UPI003AAE1395
MMDLDFSEEQFFLDINYYFADYYKRLCVVTSGGGVLPKFLFEQENRNDEFHNIVDELPERFNSGRNENVSEFIIDLETDNKSQYFQDFDSLAKKGFHVYDKINLSNPEDTNYLLVAYPKYNTLTDSFPIKPEDLDLIPKIRQGIIFRTNSNFSSTNFRPIDLVSLLDNQKK